MPTLGPLLMLARLTMLVLAFAVTACATAPTVSTAPAAPTASAAPDKGDLDNAPDGTSITIKVGGELMVKLDTNLTTGLQWIGPVAVGPVLSPIGNAVYVNKGNEPRFIGAGGINIFRFKGEQAGRTMLQFDHKPRPWDASAVPARTVRYTVIVAP